MQHMYIPHYLHKALEKASLKTDSGVVPVIKKSEQIIESTRKRGFGVDFFWSPVFLLSVLAFIGIIITLKDKKNNRRTKLLDWLIFSITGLLGIGLLLLWFATDHTSSDNNFNILWAFAPNLFFLFYLKKNKNKRNATYMAILLGWLVLLTILWIFSVQLFAISLIPLLILLLVRYLYLYKYFLAKSNIN